MKKKIVALLMATLLIMIVLSSCFKAEVDVRINLLGQISARIMLITADQEDGSPSVNVETLLKALSPTIIDDLKERGFTVTEYHQDGYTGLVIENKNVDLNKMEFEGEQKVDYSIKMEGDKVIFDLPLTFLGEYSAYLSQLEALKPQIEEKGGYARASFTAPIKPASHNADEVSKNGKTLTWDLFQIANKESIHVEYSVIPLALIAVGILAGVSAIVVGIVLIAKVVKRNKLANSSQPAPATT